MLALSINLDIWDLFHKATESQNIQIKNFKIILFIYLRGGRAVDASYAICVERW